MKNQVSQSIPTPLIEIQRDTPILEKYIDSKTPLYLNEKINKKTTTTVSVLQNNSKICYSPEEKTILEQILEKKDRPSLEMFIEKKLNDLLYQQYEENLKIQQQYSIQHVKQQQQQTEFQEQLKIQEKNYQQKLDQKQQSFEKNLQKLKDEYTPKEYKLLEQIKSLENIVQEKQQQIDESQQVLEQFSFGVLSLLFTTQIHVRFLENSNEEKCQEIEEKWSNKYDGLEERIERIEEKYEKKIEKLENKFEELEEKCMKIFEQQELKWNNEFKEFQQNFQKLFAIGVSVMFLFNPQQTYFEN